MKTVSILTLLLIILSSIIIAINLTNPITSQYSPLDSVPIERLSILTRGVHVNRPFVSYIDTFDDFDPTYSTQVFDQDEITLMKQLGFRHVRLSIGIRDLYDTANATNLDPLFMETLSASVDRIINSGLGVVLCLLPLPHLPAGRAFMDGLQFDNETVEKVAVFWETLANHFSDRSPTYLFFEVLNEPVFELEEEWTYDFERWDYVLSVLHAVIRRSAPQHTIIVGGAAGNSIWGLTELTPLKDPNVVYNFHFYSSHVFTMQGVPGLHPMEHLHDVPYPSTPENIAPLLSEFEEWSDPWIALYNYGQQMWNRTTIDDYISDAYDWAQEHGVHLTCNEFGVYPSTTEMDDRNLWHLDVRESLELFNVGWCKQDLDFWGILWYEDWYNHTNPHIDSGVMDALGMIIPENITIPSIPYP